jgi:hypothetical protein
MKARVKRECSIEHESMVVVVEYDSPGRPEERDAEVLAEMYAHLDADGLNGGHYDDGAHVDVTFDGWLDMRVVITLTRMVTYRPEFVRMRIP